MGSSLAGGLNIIQNSRSVDVSRLNKDKNAKPDNSFGARFQNMLKKDLMIMGKGGIPIFKRRQFLQKVNDHLNPQNVNLDPNSFKKKIQDKTKKISYPIAWIDYYKAQGKNMLILQVFCGYLIQLFVLGLQLSIYTSTTMTEEDVTCS